MSMRGPGWASRALDSERQVREAAGWVARFADWNLWIGLTYRDWVPDARCATDLRRWLQYIPRNLVRTHVPAFWVVGPQRRGVQHFHVMLAAPKPIAAGVRTGLYSTWLRTNPLAGSTHIRGVGEAVRAASYGLERHANWDIGILCPRSAARCRRRNPCVEGPPPW